MHTPINLQAGVHASVSFAQDENEPTKVTDGDASVASSDYNGATEMPTYPDWNIFGEVALREGAQLDVDSELVRSISLARTLLVVSRESRKRLILSMIFRDHIRTSIGINSSHPQKIS